MLSVVGDATNCISNVYTWFNGKEDNATNLYFITLLMIMFIKPITYQLTLTR